MELGRKHGKEFNDANDHIQPSSRGIKMFGGACIAGGLLVGGVGGYFGAIATKIESEKNQAYSDGFGDGTLEGQREAIRSIVVDEISDFTQAQCNILQSFIDEYSDIPVGIHDEEICTVAGEN